MPRAPVARSHSCVSHGTAHQPRPYRFFFYAGDRAEPTHVHVERDANRAKVWLNPVRLQDSGGFPPAELARILMMVREHEAVLQRRWDDYFAD
ncbi:MAG: DUF4160 domain-containing protein [Gemmatimonadaceae bacterium]|nr:DUF4160 domain-containing protein [Gemmatimonadaceae bacterium]